MRIGLDVTAAVSQGGGIGRYVRELLRALTVLDTENEYRLFFASKDISTEVLPALPGNFRARRIPFHDIWLARVWHRLRAPLPVELITGQVDVYHSPDFALPPTFRNTPTLLTVHDLSFCRQPSSAAPGLRHYLDGVVSRSVGRATHVLADSQSTKDDLMELYLTPENKITVLYAGVGSDFSPVTDQDTIAEVRSRYGLGDSPYILSVGTLQPRKNHVRLIAAFDRALRDSQYNLVLAGGDGWMYEDVRDQVVRRGLKQRVIYPGFVAEDDLPCLYSAASMMVFPSLYEGFGLPIVEAMACGVPVIASNASCLPEVAGNASLMVDPRDVSAMATAMQELVSQSSLRAALRARGLERAEQFRWENSAAELMQIYRTIGEH